jgi:hypothetical protein
MAYSLTYNSSTAITTPAINSTKVIVVSNVACYANINGVATSNSAISTLIPAQVRTSINMMGLGNTLSLLPVGGATAAMTVTQVGNVAASGQSLPVANNSTQANVAAY